jgi:hypothetical protein
MIQSSCVKNKRRLVSGWFQCAYHERSDTPRSEFEDSTMTAETVPGEKSSFNGGMKSGLWSVRAPDTGRFRF